MPAADRAEVRHLTVTARARTVLDTAVLLPDGAAFLDRALQRHVRFPQLVSAHSRMLGRHGSAEVGRLLAAAADGTRAKSERILLGLLRQAGLRGWVTAFPFQDWELDCAFPARPHAGAAPRAAGDPDRHGRSGMITVCGPQVPESAPVDRR
ncbi:hypothetical protein [Pseudonocardia oroxyli]|uniref:Uncharacterized protein n=1 Tax=Pseudonocardia oroxyli TaxID=366584 RepID=A0A1G7FUD7_PSEOR|nr:hypothetical protein [Pseudonocardia oroxyli]SDE79345.1 hypothetical protein SAMN05216377_102101 [Pseudonocardia oroxyli]